MQPEQPREGFIHPRITHPQAYPGPWPIRSHRTCAQWLGIGRAYCEQCGSMVSEDDAANCAAPDCVFHREED